MPESRLRGHGEDAAKRTGARIVPKLGKGLNKIDRWVLVIKQVSINGGVGFISTPSFAPRQADVASARSTASPADNRQARHQVC
ncbi:MAG: hypothetical protein AB1510_13370 [Bacillota bacterium]